MRGKEMVVLVDRLREGLGPVVQVLHRVAGGSHHCFTALNNQPRVTPPKANLTIYLLISEKVRRGKKSSNSNFFLVFDFLAEEERVERTCSQLAGLHATDSADLGRRLVQLILRGSPAQQLSRNWFSKSRAGSSVAVAWFLPGFTLW